MRPSRGTEAVPYNERMSVFAPPPPLKRMTRPETLPGFRITPRIIAMLRAVAHYRFLTSDQIARLDGGSPQRVVRLLQLCFYHGLLDRPSNQHAQLAAFFDDGNRPMVYGLSRKGANVLAEAGLAVAGDRQWSSRNRSATMAFLAHTIEVAEAMMRIGFACAERSSAHLVDHRELLPLMPAATQRLDDPFRLRVAHRSDRGEAIDLNVIPDRLFSIIVDGERANFALELDRGTMSNGTVETSYRRKLTGYFEAWKQRRHAEQWGFKSFRVLTIAPSEPRIANIMSVQAEITGDAASGLFLYATPLTLAEHGALGPAWRSSTRDRIGLIE
jgi:hypothetical protein